ncbi:MAG: sulfoxide reductase heme-binding subunit YedZ [Magnetococcales bacterium]|nr:sulfoxide reductase heme-binding subunit YedZ [Magnetococcales bacterium]
MQRLQRYGWLSGLIPLVWLVLGVWQNTLGANPVERLIRVSGDWALWWLLLTLAISPLRHLTGWSGWNRWRRPLGLLCFFYALLHVTCYGVLEHFFSWEGIWRDLLKRPYITVGFCAFLLLLPLAITSTRGWMRRLGNRWGRLHLLIYPAALLVIGHYVLMTKADYRMPLLHAGVLGGLLGWRVWYVITYRIM